MKKLLVLTSNINDYNPKRIREEAEKLGVETDLVQYHDLIFRFGGENDGIWVRGETELLEYDYLILRGTGAKDFNFNRQRDAVVQYTLGKKIRVLNQELFRLYQANFDKLMQTVVLRRAGLPVIDTRAYGHYDLAWKHENDLPFIIKTVAGSHGSGVKKIVSLRGIKYFTGVYAPWKAMFQPFLRTGEDYRVIVIGGKIIDAMKRIAREGGYLTNVSAGGRFEKVKVTDELVDLSLRSSDAFQAEYSGVDIMYDEDGNPYVLEVNKAAEFKGFEKCTGKNVAGEMVSYLIG